MSQPICLAVGMLGKCGGVSLFWHSHWMVWGSVNIASPSTVLMDWLGDIP